MNTRPTPETDKFFATFADGEATPSHAEYYARLQDLERERDEAREQIEANHKATLIIERMFYEAKEERDRLAEEREQWRLSSVCRELREQRDRLAEVIKAATGLIAAKGRHNTMLAYQGLREALAAVKGGSDE